jgi:hypothetical protein
MTVQNSGDQALSPKVECCQQQKGPTQDLFGQQGVAEVFE